MANRRQSRPRGGRYAIRTGELLMRTGRVDAFLPSMGGFHFDSSFPPGRPGPVITLPGIGMIASRDATRGLGGGFVFAALDLFENSPKLAPPGDAVGPADGCVLFTYLV